jgi:hypothetical protein
MIPPGDSMPLLTKSRSLWEDRFARPSIAALLAEIPKPAATLIEGFRDAVVSDGTLTESLAWQGIPWRWALTYTDGPRTAAYVVPNPAKPGVCVPVPAGILATLPPRKLSKAVREAIGNAPTVAAVNWTQFDLTSKTLADELVLLLQLIRETSLATAN